MSSKQLPYLLLNKEQILAPISINITHRGAKLVDSICWNIFNSKISVEEFASSLCSDLNLIEGFRSKIILQVKLLIILKFNQIQSKI